MEPPEFIIVPIVASTDGESIGEMRIRKDALVDAPSFLFALGYGDSQNTVWEVKNFRVRPLSKKDND